MNKIVERIITTAFILIGLVMAYSMLAVLPVLAYTEAECLRQGYPEAHVTIWLERYCSNFDGAVTVRVTK